MNSITRRSFIMKSAAAVAGASVLAPGLLSAKNPGKNSIGFQSWIVRESIEKDFTGTLKEMAGLGYNSIEMCSPPGYAKMGFGGLEKYKGPELKKIISDAGFSCISCHYGFKELKEHGQERIDFAKEWGLQQMVLSSFGLPKTATLSDWKTAADELNKIGELSKKSGIPMGFHNHHGEFEKLEGELIYDALLKQLDPSLVKMQFQVAVINIGYKAADYFRKYPGRFISAHMYDWSGNGDTMVPLGTGKVDWKEFFEAAKVGGVKNYFVEMKDGLDQSAKFLKASVSRAENT
ncbi:MAG TPA: sugar phosphate isomerase/epimerase [Chryseolinea sp.]|nr:sugar phosphate isomerase/epimerase [Chryseolinea sp.]